MREERPNPEELLLQIQKEEEKKIKKGKCTFFWAMPPEWEDLRDAYGGA